MSSGVAGVAHIAAASTVVFRGGDVDLAAIAIVAIAVAIA